MAALAVAVPIRARLPGQGQQRKVMTVARSVLRHLVAVVVSVKLATLTASDSAETALHHPLLAHRWLVAVAAAVVKVVAVVVCCPTLVMAEVVVVGWMFLEKPELRILVVAEAVERVAVLLAVLVVRVLLLSDTQY
jgi:hypothetical protein